MAEMVERAYRLAQSLEGLTGEKVLASHSPDAIDYTLWVLAAELLSVLDEGRASLVRPEIQSDMTSATPE